MEAETIGGFTQFINSVGFPIFVAVWMLWNNNTNQKKLDESINKQTVVVTQLVTLIEDIKKSG